MDTQLQTIRVPPSAPPPTRNTGGYFEPGEPRLPLAFWSEVLLEMRRVRWPGAHDVAARTLVAIGLLALLALFAGGCGSLAQAVRVMVGA